MMLYVINQIRIYQFEFLQEMWTFKRWS